MADLGLIGSGTTMAYSTDEIVTGDRSLSHTSVEAVVSSDAYPAVPIMVSAMSADLQEDVALSGSIQPLGPITGSVGT